MPTEPEPNIEELLKAYRDQRRQDAGAPMELHPVNRALLQKEVAARHPLSESAQAGAGFNWLAVWLRLAWLTSACALLLVGFVFLQQRDRTTLKWQMAQEELSVPAMPMPEQSATQPAALALVDKTSVRTQAGPSSTAPPVTLHSGEESLGNWKGLGVSVPAPMIEARSEVAPIVRSESAKAVEMDGSKERMTINESPALAGAPLRVDPLSRMPNDAKAAAPAVESRQWFFQKNAREKYRANFNSPPWAPVLTSFEIERRGETIRIIDADGSTYLGTLTQVPPPEAKPQPAQTRSGGSANQRALAANSAPASPANQEQPKPRVYFQVRASGTNQTLNQSVQLEAELVMDAEPSPSVGKLSQGKTGTADASGDEEGAPPKARLQGRVTIGGTQQQEIEALPAR